MKRRHFILQTGLVTGGVALGLDGSTISAFSKSSPERLKIQWHQDSSTKFYTAVTCDGKPLVAGDPSSLFTGFCRLASEAPKQATRLDEKHPNSTHGPIRIKLQHSLHNSGSGNGKDLLKAVLTMENRSEKSQTVVVGFAAAVQPTPDWSKQSVHVPLATLIDHPVMGEVGKPSHKEADWALGTGAFVAHYLEPQASDPAVRAPAASLLIPLVDIYHPCVEHRVSLMAGPEQARRFATHPDSNGHHGWTAQAVFTLAPKQKLEDCCFLLIHGGNAKDSWNVFHSVVHRDELSAIDWLAEAKVHYYDFLSAAEPEEPREDGYDIAVQHFREFHVGLATQHGYYPGYGDYIQPGRDRWIAMPHDKQGPVEMSLDKIKARIKATRQAGARAGIYMHLVALDDGSKELFAKLSDARLVTLDCQPKRFYWDGPDVKGKLWQMSMAAPEWRAHLLEQARWIMEILQPDAIVIDETFGGLGYDEHPRHRGPQSAYSISFFKELRTLVRSFGQDRAVLASDVGMSGFALWTDGEGGDHAYPPLLGDPGYRRSPTRYRAVLGSKPWLPCAWNSTKFWNEQMDLARKASAGVGLTNGWAEYTGLHRLSPEMRSKKLNDISTLFVTSPE